MCLHWPKHGELALYSIVYYRIVYYGGQIYGHDGDYEGGNLASGIAQQLGDLLGSVKNQL